MKSEHLARGPAARVIKVIDSGRAAMARLTGINAAPWYRPRRNSMREDDHSPLLTHLVH